MRVILTTLSEASSRRRIVIDAHQAVRIGRTAWADVVVAEDVFMSGVHCQVWTDRVACYLRDLDSRHGTLVNGLAVTEAVLRDGDQIQAGQTRFAVHIEGDRPEQAAAVSAAPPRQLLSTAAAGGVAFTVSETAAGLRQFSGSIDAIAPSQLAAILARSTPLTLIADLHRIDVGPWEGDQPHYLYNQLDPVACAQMSPVVVEAATCPRWLEWVQEGWGADAVVCCFSRQAFAHVAAALSEIGHFGRNAAGRGILGIGWPSVLGAIFESLASDVVAAWFDVVEFVLLEDPRDPLRWTIYGRPACETALRQAGLTEAATDTIPTQE